MYLKILGVLLLFSWNIGRSIASGNEITITDNLVVSPLSGKAYLYVATAEISGWGRVPSNGLILVEGERAFLFDTPIDNAQTKELTDWIAATLKAKVIGFVPNHWHGDCMGGLGYLHRIGVRSYANQMTVDIAKTKGLPVPQTGFADSLYLKLGETDICCYYLGGGHSADNIVVWFPSEKILFGGCLLKDVHTRSLGNLSDAVIKEWPVTVQKVLDKFPEAVIVVPGHGSVGGKELIEHTRDLLLEAH